MIYIQYIQLIYIVKSEIITSLNIMDIMII